MPVSSQMPCGHRHMRGRKQSRCQAQHTSYTHKQGHLQLKLTAEKSKWEMYLLKPNHYTYQQIISTEQKSRMCSGTAHGIHGVDFSLEHTFTFPSGKGSLLLPAIDFCWTDYFCSHSFHKPLLYACHMPGTILGARDTTVPVLISAYIPVGKK